MKPKAYLETSVIAYLAARPGGDPALAARQQITREWWQARAGGSDLYISQLVIQEARTEDEEAAERRMALLVDLYSLELNRAALDLARALLNGVPLAEDAVEDALHVALATVHGMDDLLTWDDERFAAAPTRQGIERVCRSQGYEPPAIRVVQEPLEEKGAWQDPIVAEIRQARQAHARRYGHVLQTIYDVLKQEDEQAVCKKVSLAPRHVPPAAS